MVPDSLHEMVRALQWASGPVYKLAQTGEDSDAAEVREVSVSSEVLLYFEMRFCQYFAGDSTSHGAAFPCVP